jgi:serralysin
MEYSVPATSSVSPSGNIFVNALLGGSKWAVSNLSYSFPTSASFYGSGYGSGEPGNGFGTLNAQQQTAARAAFASISAVANVTFTQMAETSSQHADLRLALSNVPPTAWAYFPTTAAAGGDVWFNNASGYYTSPVKGNYAFMTFLHEIGHAMGLEHPHENGMPLNRDSIEYSVMSYRSFIGASTTAGYGNETWGFAQSLMMYDIAALQHMYGANFNTNSGNTTYTWSPTTGEMFLNGAGQGAPGGNRILMTIWDGGGIDTYDFSNYTTNLTVDLRPGEWNTTSTAQLAKLHYDGSRLAVGNIANALQFNGDPRSLIENAKGGAGHDTITGNVAANTLVGNGGNDKLYGGDGNDELAGGTGADVLDGGNGSDAANYSTATAGVVADLLNPNQNTGDALGDTYVSIERLTGSNFADQLRGNDAANVLGGLAGNDILVGRGGSDTLSGGAGNDDLSGGLGADKLEGGDGADVANYASASAAVIVDLLTPTANTGEALGDTFSFIENITGSSYNDDLRGDNLANTLRGGNGNDTLTGRGGNDTLYGDAGNDRLVGGAGADVMYGGGGSDTFVFAAGDSVPTAADRIADYLVGVDRIDLRAIDANASLSGDQAFSYIGTAAFTGKAGQLSFVNGVISGDTNGDRVADFKISVGGTSSLFAADFLL